jgi:uncharacterized membrane protein (UPF0182 family)
MPELRLVVLATQERLAFAPNFETALRQLMGNTPPAAVKEGETAKPDEPLQPGGPPPTTPAQGELIKQAGQVFADYQRLTSEGKLGEAGQKLDELKRILAQLQTSEK